MMFYSSKFHRINLNYISVKNSGRHYYSVKDLSPIWKEFYLERFGDDTILPKIPDSKDLIIKGKKNIVYQNVKISPDNKYLAFVTNQLGKYKVNINNTLKNYHKVNYNLSDQSVRSELGNSWRWRSSVRHIRSLQLPFSEISTWNIKRSVGQVCRSRS